MLITSKTCVSNVFYQKTCVWNFLTTATLFSPTILPLFSYRVSKYISFPCFFQICSCRCYIVRIFRFSFAGMFLTIQRARIANTFGCINKIYKEIIAIILFSNCFSLANFYERSENIFTNDRI